MSSLSGPNVVFNLVCLFLGCAIGYGSASYRIRKERGEKLSTRTLKPNRGQLNAAGGVFMVLLAVFIVVQTLHATENVREQAELQSDYVQDQAECNREFTRVLTERSGLTHLADENVRNLVHGIAKALDTPDQEGRKLMAESIAEYDRRSDQIDAARQANPYPDPRCR